MKELQKHSPSHTQETKKNLKTLNLAKQITDLTAQLPIIEMELTIQKTLDKPVIKSVFRGKETLAFTTIEKLVIRFLNSFGFSTKHNPDQIDIISVDAFEKFSYESLEDIILFFKMARAGDFGTTKRGVDSNLIFGEWFPMYLKRKSILREENHQKQKNEANDISVTYEDVKHTYKKADDKKQIEKLERYIDSITKYFDRQMLEDLIIDWENDAEKKNYIKHLKIKRRTIK